MRLKLFRKKGEISRPRFSFSIFVLTFFFRWIKMEIKSIE